MNFNLIFFEETDIIKFGMTSEEIQTILKVKPIAFGRSEFNLNDTESYENICNVSYEETEAGRLICSEIEFLKPSKVF